VAEEFSPYLQGVIDQMREAGIRAEIDDSDERMQKKIRTHTKQKIPYLLIAGDDDRQAEAVSFRFRDGSQRNQVPIADAIDHVVESIRTKRDD